MSSNSGPFRRFQKLSDVGKGGQPNLVQHESALRDAQLATPHMRASLLQLRDGLDPRFVFCRQANPNAQKVSLPSNLDGLSNVTRLPKKTTNNRMFDPA